MKKFRAIACLMSALVFSFVVVACSETTTEDVAHTPNVAVMLGGDSIVSPGVYRTILPESWTYGVNPKSASLQYALTAFAIADESVDDGVIGTDKYSIIVDYEGLTSSHGVTFSLRPGTWRIILSAYTENATLPNDADSAELADGSYEYYACGATDCVFTDTKVITLDSETNMESLFFNLVSVTNDNAAKGTLSLNFTMYPPDTFKTVSWYLSKYGETLTALSGTAESYDVGSVGFDGKFVTRPNSAKGCTSFYYTSTAITKTVAPGKYWFVLTFTDKNGKRMLLYPVLVVIDGDNTSYGDMILRKSLFSSAPLSASDLQLAYVSYGGYSVGSDDTHAKAVGSYVALDSSVIWATRLANGLYEEFSTEPTSSYVFHFALRHTWSDNADNETEYHYILNNNGSEIADTSISAGNSSLVTSIDAPYTNNAPLLDYDFSIRAENDYSYRASGVYVDTQGFNEWQSITGKKVFMVVYHLTDGIHVAYAADNVTDNSVAYFALPYVVSAAGTERIDLLSATGNSYPCITNLPTDGQGNERTLSGWKIGGQGDIIDYLEEANGENVILTPVFD